MWDEIGFLRENVGDGSHRLKMEKLSLFVNPTLTARLSNIYNANPRCSNMLILNPPTKLHNWTSRILAKKAYSPSQGFY